MNKRALFIDSYSEFGHINLNKVYLRELSKSGFLVSVSGRKSFLNKWVTSTEKIALEIPDDLFKWKNSKIGFRISQFRVLNFIKKNVDFDNYDLVIFTYFDEFVYSFFDLKGNTFVMNHSNVDGLTNKVKRFFLKRISSNVKIIVFTDSVKDRFKEYGITNVIVMPLGISKSYDSKFNLKQLSSKLNFQIPNEDEKLIIFIPNAQKYNNSFFTDLFKNSTFLDFIEIENIFLIVKSQPLNGDSKNIIYLQNYISEDLYQSIFLNSDIIWIDYPISFRYKSSACLFECFSNNKPCILSNINSFIEYNRYFNYNPFYNDILEVQTLLLYIKKNIIKISADPYSHYNELNPDFSNVLCN